jgi:hypothetical protein
MSKPEQSIPERVVPPYLYGVPIKVRAVEITLSTLTSLTLPFFEEAQETRKSVAVKVVWTKSF